MTPTVAILAGGRATRLYPVTQNIPKSMIEVVGKPFIAHQLTLLKKNGIERVVICSGYLSPQIENFVGTGERFGLSVHFSNDGETSLGTGGAVKKGLSLLGDPFFVMYGDSYLDIDFMSVYKHFLFRDHEGMMVIIKNNDSWDKSNVVFEDGSIISYDKIIKTQNMKHVDYGLSILRKSAFEGLGNMTSFDLGQLYQNLILKKQMLGYEVTKRFYEIGSVSGLAETEAYLINQNN